MTTGGGPTPAETPGVPATGVPASARKGFIRQSSTSSVAALVAMLTGLLLDVAVSLHFGAGTLSDSFFAASKIPVGLAALLMTVAVQAWVPQFVRDRRENGEASLAAFASRVFTAVMLLGLVMWGLAWAIARPLMELTAPGLSAHQIDLAASMVPVIFLIVPLVAGAETVRGALNASYSFVVPAGMNVAMNLPAALIILIAGGKDIRLVPWAYVIGAGLQLLLIIAVAWSHGVRIHPSLQLRDPRVWRTLRFTGRPALSTGLNLANRTAEQAIASFLPPGSITVLSYAQRLISALGGGTFFRPITVALLPRLADAEHDGDPERVVRILNRAIRLIVAVSLALTAFTVALADPAIRLVFHRGNFTEAKIDLLAVSLAIYGLSLLGSGLQRVLLAPFYARLDTRTPLRNTTYGVLVDLALLYPCMAIFGLHSVHGVYGVAVAYTIDQYYIVWHAWYRLRKTLPVRVSALRRFGGLAFAAALVSTAVMVGLTWLLGLAHLHNRLRLLLDTAGIAIAGGLVLAVMALAMIGPTYRARVLRRLGRKPQRTDRPPRPRTQPSPGRPLPRHSLGANADEDATVVRAADLIADAAARPHPLPYPHGPEPVASQPSKR